MPFFSPKLVNSSQLLVASIHLFRFSLPHTLHLYTYAQASASAWHTSFNCLLFEI